MTMLRSGVRSMAASSRPGQTQASGNGASGSGIHELERREAGVESALPQQRRVVAEGYEAPVVEHGDPLGLKYGGEAVRDDEHRAAIHHAVEGLLDEALALRVERTRRLVEEKHGGVAQERPRDRDTLPLAAGEAHAALAEICAVTLRQTLDKLRRRRSVRRPADFRVRRPGTSIADIVDHISGEDRGVLRHDANPRPDLRRIRALKVDSI